MSEDSGQRLDLWLWRARFFRQRSDAAKLVTKKGVRIDRTGLIRKSNKPAAMVCMGDVLTFRHGDEVVSVRILGLPERRGPAPEAQSHYEAAKEDHE